QHHGSYLRTKNLNRYCFLVLITGSVGAGLLILSSIIENYPVGGGGFINIVVDNLELPGRWGRVY
ncbi:hypothetical protein, partial [Limnospira sp. PMC 1280.21]|uniref:hypothetical protein n=1 Tax=Limnospira sp. PMC 1280.21 TaxID=2981063 RepID=UPI0028E11C5A